MDQDRIRWNGWGTAGHPDALAANEPAWRWLAKSLGMPALLATPPRELASVTLPPPRLKDQALSKLVALLSDAGVRQDNYERARHAAGQGLADRLRLRAGDLSSAPDAVLYPRNEADVLAVLALCAELGIAVIPFGSGTDDGQREPVSHAAWVALDLARMNRVTDIDLMSGLAEVEAGITGPELERQLAARGMMLGHRPDDFEFSTLGGWIARPRAGQETARYGSAQDWLHRLRVATSQGVLATGDVLKQDPDLKQVMLGSRGAFGVVTSATIRIRALPAKEEHRGYLFPDFAAGLAAAREAQRIGLQHAFLRLSDDGATRVARAVQRAPHAWNIPERFFDVYLAVRHFDGNAAQLLAGFSGDAATVTASRKRFDTIARRLGALALGVDTSWQQRRYASGYRRDTLLDRGIGMDSLEIPTSWSELPALYVAVRMALKQAMRAEVPRAGARGLLLADVAPTGAQDATLKITWLFARRLEEEVIQAQAIRRAATGALPSHESGLDRSVLRAIKQALDPKDILNPGLF